MIMHTIGTCTLGDRPRVVVALRDDASRDDAEQALRQGGDIIELRMDNFSDKTAGHVLDETKKYAGLPIIGTIRMGEEGGGWQDSEARRLALYQAVMPSVNAVDIELHANAINDEVVACARAHDVCVIGSFHDFSATPDMSILNQLLEKGAALGVDIVKIAAHCAEIDESRRLAKFMLEHPAAPLIVIGMGRMGMMSRIFFPALGSLLTYTFIGEPSAPGQLNLEETIHLLRRFYDLNHTE